jgi:uncharacterized protein YecE (DUF72 family)
VGDIFIGTSGFFYRDWKGVFYPDNMPQRGYLPYYADQFKALELNFSYYKIPDARQSEQMIERSLGRLQFTVKAFRQLTHEISDRVIKEVLPLFKKGISPFLREGCLGAILLQFPQSFHYTVENRVYLKTLMDEFSHIPIAIEFRHREWLRASVLSTLEAMHAALVCVDEPQLPLLLPPVVNDTSEIGYLRFHGRNNKDWYGTDARTRYDYLYTEEELNEWVKKIRDLRKRTKRLFVFFNNHAKAQAIKNAKMLINLLGMEQ